MHPGGPSRVGPAGRAASTSSAGASPTSSSSAVSTPQGGLPFEQQHQHSKQALQQAYQAGVLQGVMPGGNFVSSPVGMQVPHQSRKFFELAQQHSSSPEGQNRNQGIEQRVMTPEQQAYMQYAIQAAQQKSALAMQSQQAAKIAMMGAGAGNGKEQDMRMGNLKMQDLMAMQAANQAHASSSKNTSEQYTRNDKSVERGQQLTSEHRNEQRHPAQPSIGQLVPANLIRPMQAPQTPQNIPNTTNNHLMAAQLQAMQKWALERNIDLSQPASANLMAQLIPLMQSRMAAQQKTNEGNAVSQPLYVGPNQQVASPPLASENSPHANSSSDMSGQSASAKSRQNVPPSSLASASSAGMVNSANNLAMQQHSFHSRDNQMPSRSPVAHGNGPSPMRPPQSFTSKNQTADQNLPGKNALSSPEALHMQHLKQLNKSSPQSAGPSNDEVPSNSPQDGPGGQAAQQRVGFTKQQLHVLKAQILAFRRLKKGESTLPNELLRAIAPLPLDVQLQQQPLPAGGSNQDRSGGKMAEEQTKQLEPSEKETLAMPSINRPIVLKEETFTADEKATAPSSHMNSAPAVMRDSTSSVAARKEERQTAVLPVKSDQDVERGAQKAPVRSDNSGDKGKNVVQQFPAPDATQLKKPVQTNSAPQPKDTGSARKYHGPLFDFPFFTRKHDSVGTSGTLGTYNSNSDLTLAYDVKDLLFEEGVEMLNKKRSENLKKINGLLAVNLERKRIRPDLVLRLQIEEKKLKLVALQTRLRDEVDQQQQEIMAMPDRPYRKFVRLCERQRMEQARQVQISQKAMRDKQLKSIFQWRKKLLEAHWAIRDARTARNRGVAKYHERMLREFSKRKDEDRTKRMEALKNNDVERYREMLLEQQSSLLGDASERYAVLSSFLTQTEEYLQRLGSKITAAKNQQEVEEAANAAAAAARQQGLSEEEVRAAAACAGEEVMIRNRFMEMNAPKNSSSVSKYYNLAHAVNERVIRQPSMLRAGTLRDYQLVGLQWMLSLYNNKLNGILADEMGLGKTVQVMALIAYLMEFKGNYGPHLIIVPNAVLVNWKSEFLNWLPSVSCIFYVGGKDQRSKLFSQEVCAMKFNVLVTTYEFIMYDRSKLSKVDWKYIIIDEAQRMKDRESVLARDLDRYRCHRRLLLTGTPLQNDLKELWSLLNLLLPEVFDNRKAFHDWFSKPFQKEDPAHDAEDEWLETEKKVIIIHRLHQILEPFMLRRRVEDVESALPPKVSVVLKCKMSAIQGAVYDWIKSTGTLRVDPEEEERRVQRSPLYQARVYRTLNNRCMELRKTCNHPLLNYPYFTDLSKEFLVKSCGKLWVLDRILIKLQRTGHRVLLFSTMTKLLDILEEYLQWRRLIYRRIDGTTSLEDRESAIVDFNSPDSDCFIFLLSIRAAGRGLNLQSADTVVIYDPDPNPKNEEQAVARAHRIGQTREVRVIYMEAVVGKISSHQKEDELRSGVSVDSEDDLAGKDRYMGSIESLIRNNIQQYKIDMADEVINAGRFDQRTTHEERRMTLETLLHDEERYQETVHDVPSLQEVNRMIARSDEELELFDQMDEEFNWIEEMTRYDQVPKWLRASTKDVNAAVANLSKKPSKNILFAESIAAESNQVDTERKRGRTKGKKSPNYKEIDDENGEYSEASSDERNDYSVQEEEGEIREFEDDEYSDAVGATPATKEQSEDDGPAGDDRYDYPREITRNSHLPEEGGSSGSSPESQRITRIVSPVSLQKFGSLSALDARPGSVSKKLPDDLEEGEIAISGDSHMDRQQSGSGFYDRDEGEDEQVVQPKIKRKRSIRLRPRHMMERTEGKSSNEPIQDHKHRTQLRKDAEMKAFGVSNALKHDQIDSSKSRRNLPSRRVAHTSALHASAKTSRLHSQPASAEDVEPSREVWDGKAANGSGVSVLESKMSDVIQRRCKNVVSKFQRRINKEGQQIIPLLTELWKRIESSGFISSSGNNLLDLRKIEQRVDGLVYGGVMDLVTDVQFMLKSSMQYYRFSHEVRSEARKVHDLFFDILKIAFPDTDFREARSALSFSHQIATPTSPSPRLLGIVQNKRHRLANEVEPEAGATHNSGHRGANPTGEEKRLKVHVSQREMKLGSVSGSSRDQYQPDDSPVHPGELVICKKKRKDRDKSAAKSRTGSAGPVSPPSMNRNVVNSSRTGSAGPVSPPSMNRNVVNSSRTGSAGPVSPPSMNRNMVNSGFKDTRTQQSTHQQGWDNQSQTANGSSGNVGWANPVKRLRTDSGKRRPSHL